MAQIGLCCPHRIGNGDDGLAAAQPAIFPKAREGDTEPIGPRIRGVDFIHKLAKVGASREDANALAHVSGARHVLDGGRLADALRVGRGARESLALGRRQLVVGIADGNDAQAVYCAASSSRRVASAGSAAPRIAPQTATPNAPAATHAAAFEGVTPPKA